MIPSKGIPSAVRYGTSRAFGACLASSIASGIGTRGRGKVIDRARMRRTRNRPTTRNAAASVPFIQRIYGTALALDVEARRRAQDGLPRGQRGHLHPHQDEVPVRAVVQVDLVET